MATLLALLMILSQLQCSLSGNSTASPSTTLKAAAGAASKSTTTTEAPAAAKVRSQKDLLGSFGNFNLTAEKASAKTDTPIKPVASQKSLLGSFGSFAKAKPKPEPKAPPVTERPKPDPQTCIMADMCKTMNGICNKGTCVHVQKNCEADIKCDCDPGYTGQFCSIAIADITETTTKASSTTAKASAKPSKNNGKHHVNGNIDKTKFSTENHTNIDNGQIIDNAANGNKISNTNGNGKITDTSARNKNGNGVESNNTTINGNGNGNGETKASSVEESVTSKQKSKDGSYRKGPEAVVTADNSPISIDSMKMKPHKIKTTNMSVIKQTTDTVTFATVSVKNTFIGTVNKQTSRLQDGNVGKSLKSSINKQRKKSQALTNSREKKPATEHPTTPTPTTTTLASQTKKVVIDSSNNMTINVLTNASIKNGKKTAIKETKGSVDIQNKTLDIHAVKVAKAVEREKTKILNGADHKGKETSQQSARTQTSSKMSKETSGQARSEAKSPLSPNTTQSKQSKAGQTKEGTVKSGTQKSKQTEISDVVVKAESKTTTANKAKEKSPVDAVQQSKKQKQTENGQIKQNAAVGKSNFNNGSKITTNKPANMNNKKDVPSEKGTNGAHYENKSVFSPIIALLQKSEAVEKSHKDAAKSSHADSKANTAISTPRTVTPAKGHSGAKTGGSVAAEKTLPA